MKRMLVSSKTTRILASNSGLPNKTAFMKKMRHLLICLCFLAMGNAFAQDPSSLRGLSQEDQQKALEVLTRSGAPVIRNEPTLQLPQNGTLPQFGSRTEAPLGPTQREKDPPTEFQRFISATTGQALPIFGQQFFQTVPSTFTPLQDVAVPANYTVGPGDELRVRAWGQIDVDYKATVDRTGQIYIPKIGTIQVSGVRYENLEAHVKGAINRIYQNFEVAVTLGKLRSIQVFVVGEARVPGTYTISSLSTLVNALFASGGPLPIGSMRRIQLKRNNAVVSEFDLYELLLKGDKSKDVSLQTGDVIYIPPVNAFVAIQGSVNVPAIYELKNKSDLGELISLAGGLSATAENRRVTIERIQDKKIRTVEQVQLSPEGLATPLVDGDLVTVFALSARFENAVTLRGNVSRPGRYPWHPGLRISDVLPDRQSLITRDYWRLQNDAQEDETKGVQTKAEIQDQLGQSKEATGEAKESQKQKGTQSPSPQVYGSQGNVGQGTAVEQQRLLVSRKTAEINWDYALVERFDVEKLTTSLLPFNLGKAILEHDTNEDLILQPGDVITIFSQDDLKVPIGKQSRFVRLEGEFKNAGVYKALPGETLRQLVNRVGGFTDHAYLFGAGFTRESTRIEQQKKLDEYTNRLESEMKRFLATRALELSVSEQSAVASQVQGEASLVSRLRGIRADGRVVLGLKPSDKSPDDLPDLVLEDGDTFVMPYVPATVRVIGAVNNSSDYIYRKGSRVSDYLRMAGGTRKGADRKGLYVLRADGSVRGNGGAWLSGDVAGLTVMPGDTVIVPEAFNIPLVRGLREWTQILSQLTISAASVAILAGR